MSSDNDKEVMAFDELLNVENGYYGVLHNVYSGTTKWSTVNIHRYLPPHESEEERIRHIEQYKLDHPYETMLEKRYDNIGRAMSERGSSYTTVCNIS